jgi:hypothetical protein
MVSVVNQLVESAGKLLARVDESMDLQVVHFEGFGQSIALRLEHVERSLDQVLLHLVLDNFNLTGGIVVELEHCLLAVFALAGVLLWLAS